MRRAPILSRMWFAGACVALVGYSLCACSVALGQGQPPGGGGGNQGGLGVAGVIVDADGVLAMQVHPDPTGSVMNARRDAARDALNPKILGQGGLRWISLQRLENALAAQLKAGRVPTDEMRYLAGLVKLQYVFFYPGDEKDGSGGDIVIGGPAEGWVEDLSGRVVGVDSGRPVLQLQDLVVALRAYSPKSEELPMIGCSIDPTQEGLAMMQQFLKSVGRPSAPGDPEFTRMYVDGLRNSLSMQTVAVLGVPATTHFAQVLVEADYRMKLIGLGVERLPIKFTTYVDRLTPSMGNANSMTRWYFMPDYQCVKVCQDSLGMELVGQSVKLVGAGEVVGADGQRTSAAKSNKASQIFTEGFTRKYSEIAQRVPVYAQLRNLIDIAVAAAFIKQQDYYGKSEWSMETFGSEETYPVETYTAPVQVETVVTSIWKGGHLTAPLGGGVHVEAELALNTENLLADEGNQVQKVREETSLKDLPKGTWWWNGPADPNHAKLKPGKKSPKKGGKR